MYNESLKAKFIEEYTKSMSRYDVCVKAFNAIEPYENDWGADFCTRTSEELAPVIEQLVGFRVRSRWQRIIIFKKYVSWCIASGVEGACDGMLHVDNVGLSKIRSQTIFNPMELQRYLNAICEPESEQTIDNIYRCFYWLAFAGMDEEDILKVRCADVDFQNMVVHFDDDEYEIYRDAIPAFRNAATLTEFVYKHPNYPPDKRVIRNRAPGNTLIRGIRSAVSVKSLRVELSRRSKKCIDDGLTEKQLSYYRVWLSGLFYRVYQGELAGIPVDFSSAAVRFMDGKIYKLDSGRNTPEAKKRAVMNDYLQDYERWKAAFPHY